MTIVGRQHAKDGWITIRPTKTGVQRVLVNIPILPELQRALDAGACGDLAFPVSERKTHCSMHGIRKAGATVAAENGATDDELRAIFGWTTKKQTTLYTKMRADDASRDRLCASSYEHKKWTELPHRNSMVLQVGQKRWKVL